MLMPGIKPLICVLALFSFAFPPITFAQLKESRISTTSGTDYPLSDVIKISAFKDISAFILDTMQKNENINLDVHYVKNADEAHTDLTEKRSDLVFMSYDDTLSLALEDKNANIVAVMPIHGGILDFCGAIDIAAGKTTIGIDTDTGYARGLRSLLKEKYGGSQYPLLRFDFAGATNIRYEKLLDKKIDATLLNPPYSFKTGIGHISRLIDIFGAYQGVVVNVNRSWIADERHQRLLQAFSERYYKTVREIKSNPERTIKNLQNFYSITYEEAKNSYERLWEADGLSLTPSFDEKALYQTEQIFSKDTNQPIPSKRTWISQKF